MKVVESFEDIVDEILHDRNDWLTDESNHLNENERSGGIEPADGEALRNGVDDVIDIGEHQFLRRSEWSWLGDDGESDLRVESEEGMSGGRSAREDVVERREEEWLERRAETAWKGSEEAQRKG